MSLGNALPTEAATASVDSCPVLRVGTEWEKGSFIARRMETRNVSGDSSSMNQAEAQHGDSDGSIHPPGGGKGRKIQFFRVIKRHRYLRSVDFDGYVVALRRPLGGFGHLETGADQVDAELSLAGDTGRERPSIHSFIGRVRLTDLWTFGRAVTVSRCGEGDGTAQEGLGKLQIRDWKRHTMRVGMRLETAAVYK